MRLEYANLICPKCGSGNYMRHLVGEYVGKLNVKCINCNSYFKLSDFYRMAGSQEPKTMTNADALRAMSDEELAEWVTTKGRTFGEEYEGYMSLLDWLKSPVEE